MDTKDKLAAVARELREQVSTLCLNKLSYSERKELITILTQMRDLELAHQRLINEYEEKLNPPMPPIASDKIEWKN